MIGLFGSHDIYCCDVPNKAGKNDLPLVGVRTIKSPGISSGGI